MSTVQLLNVNNLNNKYDNTIDFDNIEAQTAYFDSLVNMSIDLPIDDDYVYIRENKTIEVDCNKQELLGVNYLRFSNGNKWCYAFITSKNYINEFITSITFEIDVLQTFMFDYEILESYISREHQDRFKQDGTPIFNIKDEELDLGQNAQKINETTIYKNNSDIRVSALLLVCDDTIIVNDDGSTENTYGQVNDPTLVIPDCLRYYLIPIVNKPQTNVYDNSGNLYLNSAVFCNLITSQLSNSENGSVSYKQAVRYSHIQQMFILPYIPFEYSCTLDSNDHYVFNSSVLTSKNTIKYIPTGQVNLQSRSLFRLNRETLDNILATFNFSDTYNLAKPKSYNDLTNINCESKLATYPYNYYTLDCEQTEPLVIKPQLLDKWGEETINIYQSIGVNPVTKYSINGYCGDYNGSNYALINNTLNNLNLTSDKLADYLAQNSASATTGLAVNTGVGIATGVLSTIATASVGNVIGKTYALSSGLQNITNNIMNVVNENFKRQDLTDGPPNYKDKGNNVYAYWQQYGVDTGLKIKQYQPQESFRKFAYNFMQHYGYKCNDFKVPNLKSRYYYNYIQTNDLNLKSNIDNEYIDTIKAIYAKGITFWHYRNPNTFKGINNYLYENIEMNLLEE